MTQARPKENAIGAFIKQIDKAMDDIVTVSNNTYQDTCKLLAVPLQFLSQKDLDNFYENEKQRCIENEKDKEKLLPIIHLYHVLAKYKFIYTQLEKAYHLTTLEEDITELKQVFSLDNFHLTHLDQVKKNINILDSLYEMMAYHFIFLKYFKQDTEPSVRTGITREPLHKELKPLYGLLIKLPSIHVMNEAIDYLQKSLKQSDPEGRKDVQVLLNGYIKQITDIKAQLHQQLNNYKKFFDDLIEERNLILEKKPILDKHINFFHVLTFLSEIIKLEKADELKQAFTKASHICNQTSSTRFSSLTYLYKGNVTAATTTIFNGLDAQHKKLIEQHFTPLVDIKLSLKADITQILNSAKSLCAHLDMLNELFPLLAEKLKQINHLWQEGHTAISAIQNTLINHLVLPEEESEQTVGLSFLSRHWGKMVIGLFSGSSTSLTISFLLSLSPGYFAALCVSGGILGGAIGASVGASADYFSNDFRKNNDQPDEIMLLRVEPESNNDENSEEKTNPGHLIPYQVEEIGKIQQILENIETNSSTQNTSSSTNQTQRNNWWSLPLTYFGANSMPKGRTDAPAPDPNIRSLSIVN